MGSAHVQRCIREHCRMFDIWSIRWWLQPRILTCCFVVLCMPLGQFYGS